MGTWRETLPLRLWIPQAVPANYSGSPPPLVPVGSTLNRIPTHYSAFYYRTVAISLGNLPVQTADGQNSVPLQTTHPPLLDIFAHPHNTVIQHPHCPAIAFRSALQHKLFYCKPRIPLLSIPQYFSSFHGFLSPLIYINIYPELSTFFTDFPLVDILLIPLALLYSAFIAPPPRCPPSIT